MYAYPERVFVNGTFYTMTGEGRSVSALAVLHGRIVALGDDASILSMAGPRTEVVDLEGNTVFPGFSDTHTHMVNGAETFTFEIDFDAEPSCRSIADVKEKIRRRAVQLPEGTWILGRQVRDEKFKERRYPTRWELDEVAPNHPVFITSSGSHIGIANSLALKLAGITRDTQDPPGGKIDRDPGTGEPNGILRERGKLRLNPRDSQTVIPPYTEEQSIEALRQAVGPLVLAQGVTSIDTIVVDGDEARVYARAVAEGAFPARVNMMVRIVEAPLTIDDVVKVGLIQGFGNDRIRMSGLKLSIDGGSLQKNAALHEPYPGEPDNRGIVRIEQAELNEVVDQSHRLGYRLLVHAIGDRALDMAFEALELAQKNFPRSDHRHRIEHYGNLPITDGQLRRGAALEVVPSPQPSFLWVYGDKWLDIFGEERMRRAFAFRSLREAGLRVIGNSDFPMCSTNPLVGVQAAVTRKTEGGAIIEPGEALSVYEALEMYTVDAAYGNFEESYRGTLEIGKQADLTVLGDDPFRIDPDGISSIPVEMTVVDGEIVYRREGA